MLTAKDKKIIAGFILIAVIGFVGSIYFLMFGQSPKEVTIPMETQEEEDHDIKHHHHEENEDWIPDRQASFEDEDKAKLTDEKRDEYLSDAEQLLLDYDYKGMVNLLEPVVKKYNVTQEAQRLTDLYTDANLVVVQSTMTDPLERADVVSGMTDPLAMAYTFANLPTDVYLYAIADGNSAVVSGKGDVVIRSDMMFHPILLDVEGEEYMEKNPIIEENPYIKLYLDNAHEYYDLLGFYEIPLRIQGVDVTNYIASFNDHMLISIGYYVDNPAEHGDRFQSIDWHRAHRQRLEEAVTDNWGKDNLEGEKLNETEVNNMEE